MTQSARFLAACALLLIGCSSRDAFVRETLTEVERIPLLATVPDSILGGVSDYLVTSNGALILADSRNRHLILLDEHHNLIRTIGRGGQGPGEFQYPYRICLVGDTLRVWDRIAGRLQKFSSDGTFLSMSRPVQGISGVRPITMSNDGRLLLSTYGIGTEYAVRIYTRELNTGSEIGALEAPSTSLFVIGLSKADARSRNIPDGIKNRSFAIPTSSTEILIVHTAIPVFKKYLNDGTEVWRVEQDLPELQTIRDEAFEQTIRETGNQLFSPNYWRGGVSDGEGGCYLQLYNTEAVVLFHVMGNGSIGNPIEGPDGNWGVMKRFNEDIWFFSSGTFELMRLQVRRD